MPCGLMVTFCHIYVYIVATRHARAIKKEPSVNDRMRPSATYKITTTSEDAVLKVEVIPNVKTTYLTIPQFQTGRGRPLKGNLYRFTAVITSTLI